MEKAGLPLPHQASTLDKMVLKGTWWAPLPETPRLWGKTGQKTDGQKGETELLACDPSGFICVTKPADSPM